MVSRLRKYSHNFYRVTPRKCPIYRMGNGYHWRLLLVIVDIIGNKLPQVTELPFVRVFHWLDAPHHMNQIDHLGLFFRFQHKHLFKMNLMHGNTDNMSHVPILAWPVMMSSLTSHGSWNDITHYFFAKFVSCTVIWCNNITLKMSMEDFNGEPKLCKFVTHFN